jgi:spermidine/putrescine transport system substrate-binding protein
MVEEQLKALKPNLAGWEADFGKELMTKGEIWFCYAWGGDAVWAIEEAAQVGVSLAYTVPKEGSNVWFDGWVIPKYAKNVKAASYFLNYLCQPEVALKNMDVSGYSSAVATPEILETLIDSTLEETVNASYFFGPGNDSLKINPIQYPDSTVIARCALINDYLDKNEEVLDMWSRAKGDSLNSGMSIMIGIVVVLLIILIVMRFVTKARSKARRRMKSKRS